MTADGAGGEDLGSAPPRGSKRRCRWVARGAVGVGVLGLVYVGVTFLQVWRAVSWEYTSPADAVVVLGAAQYDGAPSPAFRGRLDHAHELWRAGRAPVIVLTGSKREGDRFTEAYAGFEYLRKLGVPESALVIVDDGTGTWESLAASGRVLRQRGMSDVILVSDPYHSFRLVGVADEVGLDAYVSPTDADVGLGDLLRETAIVSVGRLVGYRRAGAWLG